MGKKHGQTCHRRYAQKTNVVSDMAKKMQPTHAKRKTWWRVRKNMHQLRRRENAIDDMRRKKNQVTSTKMYNRWQNLENVFDSFTFTFTSPLAPSWRIGSQGWEKNLYHFSLPFCWLKSRKYCFAKPIFSLCSERFSYDFEKWFTGCSRFVSSARNWWFGWHLQFASERIPKPDREHGSGMVGLSIKTLKSDWLQRGYN